MSPFMKCSSAACSQPKGQAGTEWVEPQRAQRGGETLLCTFVASQILKSLLIGINQLFMNIFTSLSGPLDGCQMCVTLGLDRCQSYVGFSRHRMLQWVESEETMRIRRGRSQTNLLVIFKKFPNK